MMTNNVEQRAVSLIQCRLNDLNDASRTFEGYGNVFNIVDSHGTSFAPGCFAESLAQWKSQKRLPFMFLNHDMRSLPIGKYLEMSEDDYGLRVKGELIDTTDGENTYKCLRANIINGLSVSFIPLEYETHDSSEHHATFKKAHLVEVSVVTEPSNGASRIENVRSLIENGMTVRELENMLRRYGASRADAVAISSQFESKSELRKLEDERRVVEALDRMSRAMRAR